MNRNPKHKAAADPLTIGLLLLLGLGAGIFGSSWKPLEFLRPAPPVAELTKLQAQLAQVQADAEKARWEREAAVKAERAKLEQEIRSAQEDTAGVQAALAAAPAGPEVKLAANMAVRVDMKLAAAIGDLPKANRDAMMRLIADALAGKDAEFASAMAKRDAEFATLRGERDVLQAQIPVLTQKVAKAEETAKVVQAEVTKKTDEVKVIAKDLDEEKRAKGSFKASAERAINWVMWIVGIWAFFAFIVPGLVKYMPSGAVKNGLRMIAGLVTSPLLHVDADRKITELVAATNPPFQK